MLVCLVGMNKEKENLKILFVWLEGKKNERKIYILKINECKWRKASSI